MNGIGFDVLAREHVAVEAFDLAQVDKNLATLLDPAEHFRAASIVNAATRHDFIAGRVVQRLMAAQLLQVDPRALVADYNCPDCSASPLSSHGRPGYQLGGVPAPVSISFSRSHGWALAAMIPTAMIPIALIPRAMIPRAGIGLGIDVQHIPAVVFAGYDDVALSAAEKFSLAQLEPATQDQWRARTWARKEALAKVTGLGLRTDPRDIMAYPELEEAVTGADAKTDVWDLAPGECGLPKDFAGAVALRVSGKI